MGSEVGSETVGAGGVSGAGVVGAAGAASVDSVGGIGMVNSGIFMDSSGAIGSGAGGTISTFGSGKGPTGSANSPVSSSGMDDGAATGSEKTGSVLVVLVISSIAFCRSLSTVVWFWSIVYAHLIYIILMSIIAQIFKCARNLRFYRENLV